MDEQSLLGRVLDVLRAGGAEGDVYLEDRSSLEISVRDGRLEQISRAGVRGLAIRAMHEGRLGFVHTSAADESNVGSAAEKALDLARSANQRDDLMIPDPTGPGDGSDEGELLDIYDPSITGRPIEEKQEWVRSAEAAARDSDPKITRTEAAEYTEDLAGYWIANTKGLFRHFRRSHIEVGMEVVAEDQGEMQVGEDGAEVVRWADLPGPGDLGRSTAERAVRMLGGRPVKTGRFPVVFSPDAGYALLIYLATALNGHHLSRRRSWLSERSGTAIASPIVTVRDNARMPHGPASLPFDAEGVDTRDIALIEKGKVAGRLLDLASANRLDATSTGSSRRRGYEQLPEIRASNLYLEPGKVKPEQLLAKVEKGLWVWGLSGWWIGLDPSNTQFSSAAYGLWIENGKPAQPVARVTIAGGLEEILTSIDEVADDLVWNYPTKTPTFRVAGMSISGV
jgi:PmbA protein